ncbi:MAG: hypothetical protein HY393_01795 [Candidatus Diapherotrites archaeon]|nr:hypothetical protein [Candidatus Diapherotrites archaeon]
MNPRVKTLLFLVLATLVALGLNGFPLPGYDHDFLVPFAQKISNPSLYGQDLVVEDVQPYYPSLVPLLFSFFYMLGVLNEFLLLGYALTWLAFVAGVYLLARTLFPGQQGVAWLAVVLAVFSKTMLSAPYFADHLTSGNLVLPFLLASIVLYLRNKRLPAWALLGIALNIHPAHALYGTGMYVVHGLFEAVKKKHGPWALAKGLSVFAVLGLPVIFIFLSTPSQVFGMEWIELLKARAAHHYFPLEWGFLYWILFLQPLLLYITWFFVNGLHNETHQTVGIFAGAIGGMTLIGILATVPLFTSPFLIRLLLPQATRILVLFALIYAAHFIAQWIGKGLREKTVASLSAIALAFNFLHFLIPLWPAILGCACKSAWSEKKRRTLFNVSLMGVGVYAVLSLGQSVFLPVIQSIIPFIVGTPVKGIYLTLFGTPAQALAWIALSAIFLIGTRTASLPGKIEHYLPITGILVLALGIVLIPGAVLSPGITPYNNIHSQELARAWEDVQRWAQDETPLTALFVVPPQYTGFRPGSMRSVFATRLDGALAANSPATFNEWFARMELLGYKEVLLEREPFDGAPYAQLKVSDFEGIAEAYGSLYIVTQKPHSLEAQPLYENAFFFVYFISS